MTPGPLQQAYISVPGFSGVIENARMEKRGTKAAGVENSGKGLYGKTNMLLYPFVVVRIQHIGLYEIVCKLLLITNRKSHMSFRLVPKSVTLNDLEQRNSSYFALLHRIR